MTTLAQRHAVEHVLPSAEQRQQNQQELLSKIRALLNGYEEKYRIPSDSLVEALRAGTVQENQDIAEWLVYWNGYQRIQRG